MKKSSYTNQNQYITTIILSLQMDVDTFMQHLQRGDSYETMIHQWAIALHAQQTPIAIAIQEIHQKRIHHLNQHTSTFDIVTKQQQLQYTKVMHRLQFHPLYIQLNTANKTNIQQRVQNLLSTHLYTPAQVEQMIITTIRNTPQERNDSKPPDTSENVSLSMLAKSMIAQFKTLVNVF